MKVLKSKFKRSALTEGRTTELGYGFAEYDKNGNIQLVMAISACKDYLNDVVFAEKFKKDSSKIYGFSHKYMKIFEGKKPLLVIDMLNNSSNSWSAYKEYRKLFENPEVYKLVQEFVHDIEDYLGFERTKFNLVDGYWVAEFDNRWVSDNYMISLYTLLYRMQLNFCRKEMRRIKNPSDIPGNVLMAKDKFQKSLEVIKNGKNKPFITADMSISQVHNNAYQKFNFL